MNAYTFLLLWQALLAGSAYWIRPAGWLWFLLTVAVVIIVECAVSAIARKRGLQAFSAPFQPAKYSQDSSLMMMQSAFTAALTVILLVVFSLETTWNLFWIDLAGALVFGLLIAFALRRD